MKAEVFERGAFSGSLGPCDARLSEPRAREEQAG